MKNILETFLESLEVRYTKEYADSLYLEHPYRNNMYGLKQMLNKYNIKTLGVCIESKSLTSLNYPCILHVNNDFVIGFHCDEKEVNYWEQGKKKSLSQDDFKKIWTGNALIVEDLKEAQEPDYKQNLYNEWSNRLKKWGIPALLILAIITGIISNRTKITNLYLLCIILYTIGGIVCLLLMQKQLLGKSNLGDKVCSLFHQADCNSILKGTYSHILNISWSEIGLGYFVSSILLLIIQPAFFDILNIINWGAMCFGVWSIYYQGFVEKKWCTLCVLVQIIVWCIGLLTMFFNREVLFTLDYFFGATATILICILIINKYTIFNNIRKEKINTLYKYNSLRFNRFVAGSLIENSRYYEVSTKDSYIIFGNREALLHITIVSNPYCKPCARAHKQIDRLLNLYGNDICVQYIFVVFNERLKDSCRYLISRYNRSSLYKVQQDYTEWYIEQNDSHATILKNHADEFHSEEIEQELQRHLNWCEKNSIISTPTILINGYLLPEEYDIQDLDMLINCQANIREKNIVYDINDRSTTSLGADLQSAEETV